MLRKFIVAFIALAAGAAWASEIPKLTNPVNDYANILSATNLADLNAKLKNVSITYPDNPQVMVLTVSKLPEEGIDQYANDVYRSWGVGQKGKDNGVLLVLAPNDRKVRIEVGYGLEGFIPDAVANQIIQTIKPYLKSKDWAKAVTTAVDEIVANLPKEAASKMTEQAPKAPAFTPPASKADPKVIKRHESSVGVLLLFFAVMGTIAYTIYRALRRKVDTVEAASKSYSSYSTKPHPNTTQRYRTTSSPSYSSPQRSTNNSFNDGLTTGLIVGSLSNSSESRKSSWRDEDSSSRSSSRSDDSWSSRSSSNDSWSSSSSSDSYSGGGGDSGGAGSSDSW